MIKKDLIDALKALNVKVKEIKGLTMEKLGLKLSEVRKAKDKNPAKPKKLKITEVVRSYSRKVNLGNYQSEDYFCSQKAEVSENEDINEVSAWLAYQCKTAVESSIRDSKDKPF